jgi:hypothetical protein
MKKHLRKGIALPSVLLVMVVLLMLAIAIFSLSTMQQRNSLRLRNEILSRQTAMTGLSVLEKELVRAGNDWQALNIDAVKRGYVEKNNCFYEIAVDEIGPFQCKATVSGFQEGGPPGRRERLCEKALRVTYRKNVFEFTAVGGCYNEDTGEFGVIIEDGSQVKGDIASFKPATSNKGVQIKDERSEDAELINAAPAPGDTAARNADVARVISHNCPVCGVAMSSSTGANGVVSWVCPRCGMSNGDSDTTGGSPTPPDPDVTASPTVTHTPTPTPTGPAPESPRPSMSNEVGHSPTPTNTNDPNAPPNGDPTATPHSYLDGAINVHAQSQIDAPAGSYGSVKLVGNDEVHFPRYTCFNSGSWDTHFNDSRNPITSYTFRSGTYFLDGMNLQGTAANPVVINVSAREGPVNIYVRGRLDMKFVKFNIPPNNPQPAPSNPFGATIADTIAPPAGKVTIYAMNPDGSGIDCHIADTAGRFQLLSTVSKITIDRSDMEGSFIAKMIRITGKSKIKLPDGANVIKGYPMMISKEEL